MSRLVSGRMDRDRHPTGRSGALRVNADDLVRVAIAAPSDLACAHIEALLATSKDVCVVVPPLQLRSRIFSAG
jgi:hypothetical protein